jgi:hypothetical protein
LVVFLIIMFFFLNLKNNTQAVFFFAFLKSLVTVLYTHPFKTRYTCSPVFTSVIDIFFKKKKTNKQPLVEIIIIDSN